MKYRLERDISQFQDFTIKRFGLTRPRRVWRHLVPDDPPNEPLSVWFTSAVKMQKQQVTEILNESKRCRKSDKNVCSLISDAGNNFLQTFYWWVSRAKIKNCLASFSFHSLFDATLDKKLISLIVEISQHCLCLQIRSLVPLSIPVLIQSWWH